MATGRAAALQAAACMVMEQKVDPKDEGKEPARFGARAKHLTDATGATQIVRPAALPSCTADRGSRTGLRRPAAWLKAPRGATQAAKHVCMCAVLDQLWACLWGSGLPAVQGARLMELDPGHQSCPFHWHAGEVRRPLASLTPGLCANLLPTVRPGPAAGQPALACCSAACCSAADTHRLGREGPSRSADVVVPWWHCKAWRFGL